MFRLWQFANYVDLANDNLSNDSLSDDCLSTMSVHLTDGLPLMSIIANLISMPVDMRPPP